MNCEGSESCERLSFRIFIFFIFLNATQIKKIVPLHYVKRGEKRNKKSDLANIPF